MFTSTDNAAFQCNISILAGVEKMKRDNKDKNNSQHADVYILCVPVDESYADQQGHQNAGYYGFNIYIQNHKRR